MTELEFSEKYTIDHAQAYYEKHRTGVRRRLSNYLENRMVARALNVAGPVDTILDLPCGTGRFWETLLEQRPKKLIAGDLSQSMLDVAMQHRPEALLDQVECYEMSAFDTGLTDDSVDLVLCMRLMHHLESRGDRLAILGELARISRRYVVVSLWVYGSYQAWRRTRLEKRRPERKYRNRCILASNVFEREARNSGLNVKARLDLLPGISMWRTYLLELTP
ncbi:MAG: class I SAM-dependent methyltransferase [Pseudomonadales bacterium]|jgi:ubiquinone/menaquinone biosynthesis C-methylase UbiE|nr:class I SAM-dependent methyltransferase [Pseudomonadales bacterium]